MLVLFKILFWIERITSGYHGEREGSRDKIRIGD